MKKMLAIALASSALAITSATAVGAAADPPDPIWPETPQDCRWTGGGENDPASWDRYRDYYNELHPGEAGHPGAGDIYFSSQGQCMRNRGDNPFV